MTKSVSDIIVLLVLYIVIQTTLYVNGCLTSIILTF